MTLKMCMLQWRKKKKFKKKRRKKRYCRYWSVIVPIFCHQPSFSKTEKLSTLA